MIAAAARVTFLDRRRRALYADRSNRVQIAELRATSGSTGPFFDLRRVVAGSRAPTSLVIHYPRWSRTDALHALRMRSLSRVQLRSYPMRAHNVVRRLRDDGTLAALMDRIISG